MATQWGERKTVKKGDLGELIVQKHLENKGWYVYIPADKNRPNPFDMVAIHDQGYNVVLLDVKTKPHRDKYPDTGIDLRHYNKYIQFLDKGMKVYIAFCDEGNGKIYGGFLAKLAEEKKVKVGDLKLTYPLVASGIIYFPLCNMDDIADLTDEQVTQIRSYSTRKYAYDNGQKPKQGNLWDS